MNYEQVKYKLINNDTKTDIELINEPVNWDKSQRTLKREKTFGMMTELSKNLEFVKEGADFLRQAYLFKGGEADVTLEETRFHPNTSHPYLNSTGTHDFSEYKSDELKVKVPFKSGGLNALIKAQEKEKFELERLESINGKVIDPIDKQTVALTSRRILLTSSLEVGESSYNVPWSTQIVPNLNVKYNEDLENIQNVLFNNDFRIFNENNVENSQFLYFDSNKRKDIKLKLDIDLSSSFNSNFKTVRYLVIVRTYNLDDGTFTQLSEERVLNTGYVSNKRLLFDFEKNYTLNKGDCLMVTVGSTGGGGNAGGSQIITIKKFDVKTIEDSVWENSQTLAVFFKDIGEKLMQIITGEKGRFHSDFLTNGDFSKLALTTGMWIRQFYTKTEIINDEEVEVEQTMSISLSEFLEILNVVCNTGHHIEIINGVETLVVEDLKYYFQSGTAIILNEEVSDYEEENAKDFCHSSLEFGYDDKGEYNEAMGLDEPNIKTGFTMPLKRVTTKYSKISKAKAGTYPKEFARRKLKRDYPTTDTDYDKWLFLLDLKEGLGIAFEERTWDDDFEELPKGVFSPETITNLRLTPSQIERRHSWFYGSGVLKHQDDKIRYSNTDGNNGLITKEVGKPERKERDDILISELEKALFEPKYVKFTHPLNYNISQQLKGKTEVNGRLIPNVYFKVEYIYQGVKNYGYLFQQTQKQTNLAEFKLLKAV